jgi:hypothetical protein
MSSFCETCTKPLGEGSKQEIKDLFIAEIKNTPEYQIVLQLKAFILNEIATPKIQEEVVYNFETPLSDEQMKNFKLGMIVEFGFSTNNMSSNVVFIDMKKFLE